MFFIYYILTANIIQQKSLHDKLLIFSVPEYFLGIKGEKTCAGGNVIMDTIGCRDACDFLEIPRRGTFKEGRNCYKALNGKCRQDGRQGKKVFLICKSAGNLTQYKNKDRL